METNIHRPLPPRSALGCALIVGALIACAHTDEPDLPDLPKGPEIEAVVIEGNEHYDEDTLKAAIAVEASPRFFFWETRRLNPPDIEEDQQRLLTFYRSRGYFEVEVPPLQVIPEGESLPNAPLGNPPETSNLKFSLDSPLPGPTLDMPLGEAPPEELTVKPISRVDLNDNFPPLPEAGTPAPQPEDEPEEEDPKRLKDGISRFFNPEDSKTTVYIQLFEGPRYPVGAIKINVEGSLSDEELASLEALVPFKEDGGEFLLSAHQQAAVDMTRTLKEASYAWAKVEIKTIVDRVDRRLDLSYTVNPGPKVVFGSVSIDGLRQVQAEVLRDRIRRQISAGAPYNPGAIRALQRQLYDLRLFNTVLVQVQEESRGTEEIDLIIKVSEAPFRTLKSGGGFTQDIAWQEIYGSSSWDHNYVAKKLIRLSVHGRAGWMFSPGVLDEASYGSAEIDEETGEVTVAGRNGPLLDVGAELTFPDVRARRFSYYIGPRFLIGQTRTYGFISPQFHAGASRPLTEHFTLRTGLGIEQYSPSFDDVSKAVFASTDVSLGGESVQGNQGVRFQGLLTFVEQEAIFDFRDNVLWPSQGLYASLKLQEAGIFGDFSFIKMSPEVRGYLPVLQDKFILGARLGAGVILPIEDEGAPPVLQFEAGGGNSVRGFGRNNITWWTGPGCPAPSPIRDDANGCTVAIGGDLMYLGNIEARVPIGESLGVVGFVDTGHVALSQGETWSEFKSLDINEWQLAVGAGLRYRTMIGPIRLDFAYRLRDPAGHEKGLQIFGTKGCQCGVHFAIGEAF